jgi:hypothetical protein
MAKAHGKPTPQGVAQKSRAQPAPASHPAARPAKRKKAVAPAKPAKAEAPAVPARARRAKVVKRAEVAAAAPAITLSAPHIEATTLPRPHRFVAPRNTQRPSIDAPAARSGERLPVADGRLMELHWGDEPAQTVRSEGLIKRWVKRGDALLRHLAEHGAAKHEYRADLEHGRFIWLDAEGNVSAEAEARAICSYAKSTGVLSMSWSDPLLQRAGIARLDGMAAERDDVDEEEAWHVAMEAADATGAEFLYRVLTPHAWYFLALRGLSFTPARGSFTPGLPVGLVLRTLSESRVAIESRAEPADVVRARLSGVGQALLQEAAYAYRDTEWVPRLERTGKWMLLLAERLPRQSSSRLVAEPPPEEWLDREATVDLSQAIILLEEEWALFA